MADLQTSFLGYTLKNPIIMAAGPWSGDAAGIQAAIDAGAGAVLTETISQEVYHRCSPRIFYRDGEVLSTSLYGVLSLEDWETEMEKIQKKDSRIIASIRGSTPSELAYIARKAERIGVDGLQLDLYAPIGSVITGLNNDAEQLVALITAVKNEVALPVLVRLPHYVSDNVQFLRALEKVGSDGICTIESVRGILGVDIESGKPLMLTHGGYTGRHIRPITYAAIAALSQISNLPISATGGIENYENVLEAIQLGASTVQLGSAILLHGYQLIGETIVQLQEWMDTQHIEKISQLRGRALKHLHSYEDLDATVRSAVISEGAKCLRCGVCKSCCLQGAITETPAGIQINRDLCNGCGLCCSCCPEEIIRMEKH